MFFGGMCENFGKINSGEIGSFRKAFVQKKNHRRKKSPRESKEEEEKEEKKFY